MRKLFLLLLLLPTLCGAQRIAPITEKSVKEDTLVWQYDRARAADCIGIIVGHYSRLLWITTTVRTTNDADSLKLIKIPVHVNDHGRVDSIYVNGEFLTPNDQHTKYQGGYLSEYVHENKTILWTRVYITHGNTIKEYAISMEFNLDYFEQ